MFFITYTVACLIPDRITQGGNHLTTTEWGWIIDVPRAFIRSFTVPSNKLVTGLPNRPAPAGYEELAE